MLLSFISNPMQSAQSATACSTAQYKPHFRFFAGSYTQYGITTAILIRLLPFFCIVVRKQLALDLESTLLQQNRFCLPLAFFLSYPSKLLSHFCNIRTDPGFYPVNVKTLKRMWQGLGLLIVLYHLTGVLIQVPLVFSVIRPNLSL
jgi:hypothetical protein